MMSSRSCSSRSTHLNHGRWQVQLCLEITALHKLIVDLDLHRQAADEQMSIAPFDNIIVQLFVALGTICH